MRTYYTLEKLRERSRFPLNENINRKHRHNITTVFLSHSHADAEYVEDAIKFLLTLGVHVYVDWLDEGMPKITSAKTASKIKKKIIECDKFVVLLTENSRDSKWVPWELGYADGKKDINDIAILPVKVNYGTKNSIFEGLEYMKLYEVISVSNNDFLNGVIKKIVRKHIISSPKKPFRHFDPNNPINPIKFL